MSRLAELERSGVVTGDVELAPLTTYKFGGPARWFVTAADAAVIGDVLDAAASDGIPVLMLGRGSNLVVSDAGFDGVVIRLGGGLAAAKILESGEVVAGAAMPLPKLARACARRDRGGLEFLVAVPGSVGGAVRMNAGCHGSEIAEWLLSVDVYRPGVGMITVLRDEMEMSYRHNSLPATDVVLTARLRTISRPRQDCEEIMRAITMWRKEHQPGGTFNAGSVFKNPPGEAAGRVIDSLGLKGLAIGGARVSPRHANFFEAAAGASAQDVYDLVWEVRYRVAEAKGIVLEPELRFAGEFARHPHEGDIELPELIVRDGEDR